MVKRKNSKQPKAAPVPQTRKNKEARKAAGPKPRADFKQAEVIGMLSRAHGTTIPAIMKATGWQQHSVRGFFAGVVRTKLGLVLQSEKREGADRVYRIVVDTAQIAGDKSPKRVEARKVPKSSKQSPGSRTH